MKKERPNYRRFRRRPFFWFAIFWGIVSISYVLCPYVRVRVSAIRFTKTTSVDTGRQRAFLCSLPFSSPKIDSHRVQMNFRRFRFRISLQQVPARARPYPPQHAKQIVLSDNSGLVMQNKFNFKSFPKPLHRNS